MVLIFRGLYGEIVLLIQFIKLLLVAVRKIVPIVDCHLETTFFQRVQRIHEGLDCEIVPGSVALKRPARPTDIDGFSVSVCAGDRKTDLVPTECRKIDFFREAKDKTVTKYESRGKIFIDLQGYFALRQ